MRVSTRVPKRVAIRFWGFGFRVLGLGFRVWGLVVRDLGFSGLWG